MTEPLTLRDFAALTIIAFAATLRILLITAGWHHTKAGRRIYNR